MIEYLTHAWTFGDIRFIKVVEKGRGKQFDSFESVHTILADSVDCVSEFLVNIFLQALLWTAHFLPDCTIFKWFQYKGCTCLSV